MANRARLGKPHKLQLNQNSFRGLPELPGFLDGAHPSETCLTDFIPFGILGVLLVAMDLEFADWRRLIDKLFEIDFEPVVR
ncbi:MAG TPA: hypothetical protein VKS79_18355 [Gemmataceae bacterium]|nr:hypothetical protein [Gemmataceae bacterium]